jgi:serine protease Do
MIHKFNIEEWADKYYHNQLNEIEKANILEILDKDPVLKKEWNQAIEMLILLDHAADKKHIFNIINNSRNLSFKSKAIEFIRNNWKSSAIAASIAIACSVGIQYFEDKNTSNQNLHQFTQLSRDIENIKQHQNTILKNIASSNTTSPTHYQMGGTGFAISNDGYIATNYHVIKESNEISIITSKLEEYKAFIVGYDLDNDVAILKIADTSFKFTETAIPYGIVNNNKSALGLKIYSIGYPQEELVYNEGYVSCQNGYQGDSLSYQLEIVSNPGQSGSPILDKNGNIWGLINGKSSNTTGTTYAVKSNALLDLIKNLPDHYKINVPKTPNNKIAKLERTSQVDIIKNYVVSIKTSK